MTATTINQFFAQVGGAHEPFIGDPEECGYRQNEAGVWRDTKGNTGEMRTREIDPTTDGEILATAYAGDGTITDWFAFQSWLTNEIGLSGKDCWRVLKDLQLKAEEVH